MTTEKQTDASIRELVDLIRSHKANIDCLQSAINELKEELGELLAKRGENWSDNEGYARLASGGERIFYDTESLDELIITDPLRYGWLREYRKISKLGSRLLVK